LFHLRIKSTPMTVEYFNSLPYSEQERLVLHEATVVKATVGKQNITLICDLNNFRFSACIDLQGDRKIFSALGEKELMCKTGHSRNTSLMTPLHYN
jgi:hypothetical protein